MYPVDIQKGEPDSALRRVPIWLVDATDGIEPETGITGKPWMSKRGATPAQTTNSLVEIDSTNMKGLYYIELTTGEIDELGEIFLSFKDAATAWWYGSAQITYYSIVHGAAVTGTLSTTQMTTDLAEVTDDHYVGRSVIWTSGVLKDQASKITAYLGSTKMLTYDTVTEAPANTDDFILV